MVIHRKRLLYAALTCLLFAGQAQFFQGCAVPAQPGASIQKEQLVYDGISCECPKGKASTVTSMIFHAPGFMQPGALSIKGKLTPDPLGQHVPHTVRFVLQRKNALGKVLFTTSYNVLLQPNGVIPLQTFTFPSRVSIQPKDALNFYWVPVDGDMPYGNINVTASYTPLPPPPG